MATFLRIGGMWINLDQIQQVEVIPLAPEDMLRVAFVGGDHAFVHAPEARALARALEEREGPSPRPILGPADPSPIERTAIQIAQRDWREWIERGAPPYGPNHAPSDRHKHFMDALLTIEDEADGVAFRVAYWAAANRGQGFAW